MEHSQNCMNFMGQINIQPDNPFESLIVFFEKAIELGHSEYINYKDGDGCTILMKVCIDGNKHAANMIYKLLDLGADINLTNKDGKTALMIACESKNFEAVKIFLEMGADINVVDNYGENALYYAIYAAHLDIVKLLLQYNININQKNYLKRTPLMIACFCGNLNIVQTLLVLYGREIDINETDSRGNTALMLTGTGGTGIYFYNYEDKEIVKILLENNANVIYSNSDGHMVHQIAGYESYGDWLLDVFDISEYKAMCNSRLKRKRDDDDITDTKEKTLSKRLPELCSSDNM